MRKSLRFVVNALLGSLLFIHALHAGAADEKRRHKVVHGRAVTGANHRLGEPLWYLGDSLQLASFAFLFGHNPNGPEPLSLSHETPKNTVLATGADSNFVAALGMMPGDIDPEFINIPMHETQIVVNPFNGAREKVPSVLETAGSAPSKSLPNKPITLGDWLKASGNMSIKCRRDGTARVDLWLKGLIENGVYTVWGLFGVDTDDDGTEDQLRPAALGGVPNVLIPGRRTSHFKRILGFCPMNNAALKFIDVTYHSDGNAYGGTVDMLLPGFPGFAVTHTHVAFPMNVEPAF